MSVYIQSHLKNLRGLSGKTLKISILDNLLPLGMTHPLNRLEEKVFCDEAGRPTVLCSFY